VSLQLIVERYITDTTRGRLLAVRLARGLSLSDNVAVLLRQYNNSAEYTGSQSEVLGVLRRSSVMNTHLPRRHVC